MELIGTTDPVMEDGDDSYSMTALFWCPTTIEGLTLEYWYSANSSCDGGETTDDCQYGYFNVTIGTNAIVAWMLEYLLGWPLFICGGFIVELISPGMFWGWFGVDTRCFLS